MRRSGAEALAADRGEMENRAARGVWHKVEQLFFGDYIP